MSNKEKTILKVTSKDGVLTVDSADKVSRFDTLIGLAAIVNAMITALVDSGIKYEDAEELIRGALDTGFETYADDIRGEKGMMQ